MVRHEDIALSRIKLLASANVDANPAELHPGIIDPHSPAIQKGNVAAQQRPRQPNQSGGKAHSQVEQHNRNRRQHDLRTHQRSLLQPPRQLFIDSIEAAIRKNGDDITGMQLRRNSVDNGIGSRKKYRILAESFQAFDNCLRMQPLILRNTLLFKDASQHDTIRDRKTLNQFALKDIPSQSVRPRLQNRP